MCPFWSRNFADDSVICTFHSRSGAVFCTWEPTPRKANAACAQPNVVRQSKFASPVAENHPLLCRNYPFLFWAKKKKRRQTLFLHLMKPISPKGRMPYFLPLRFLWLLLVCQGWWYHISLNEPLLWSCDGLH